MANFLCSYVVCPIDELRNSIYYLSLKTILIGYGSNYEGDGCTIYNASSGKVGIQLDWIFRTYVATTTVQNVPEGDIYVVKNGRLDTRIYRCHRGLAHLWIPCMRQGLAIACLKDGPLSKSIKEIETELVVIVP